MKRHRGKLVLHRETLRKLSHGELRNVPGGTGASEAVSFCISDGFPGNCPNSWDGACFSLHVRNCTELMY